MRFTPYLIVFSVCAALSASRPGPAFAQPALAPPDNAPRAASPTLDPGPLPSEPSLAEPESPLPSRLVPVRVIPAKTLPQAPTLDGPLVDVLPPETLPPPLDSKWEPTEPPARLEVSDELQVWLTQFVLQNLPHEYEDKRQWGKTSHVWDGLKVSNDGLKIKTKRRRKEVNDGTWKMYRVELLNPEQEFHVRLENLHDAGRQKAGFELLVTARVHAFGRTTKYVKGVQLASLSANADATLQLRMHCRLGLRLDPRKLPPDVILAPEVTDAELTLTRFHLQDVSDVGGTLARELGHGVRQVLEDKLQEERRRLPEKINRQLDKNRDKLRISLADLAQSQWSDVTKLLDRAR